MYEIITFYSAPTAFSKAEKTKIDIVLNIVVKTTNCPLNSASLPISCAIGTMETATGVQNKPTIDAYSLGSKSKNKTAKPIPMIGAITVLSKTPAIISLRHFFVDVNSNCAPNIKMK